MRSSTAWQLPALGIVVAVAIGLGVKEYLPRAYGEPRDATFETLAPELGRYVRLKGVAHYDSTVQLRMPAGILTGNLNFYAFGLFEDNDVVGKEVKVIVRTQRKPERMIDVEYLTVEGVLSPIDPRKIPPHVEDAMGERAGNFFADPVWMLEPVRILSEDGVYIEP